MEVGLQRTLLSNTQGIDKEQPAEVCEHRGVIWLDFYFRRELIRLWFIHSASTNWAPSACQTPCLTLKIQERIKHSPCPQGAHSLLSCFSDFPTRLWAPGGQALLFNWQKVRVKPGLQSQLYYFYSSHLHQLICKLGLIVPASLRR